MAIVELIAAPGIETTSDVFRTKLVRHAAELGLDPDFIATTISFESRFDPQAINPHSGASGLIQWLPKYAPVPLAELRAMSAEDQLDLVRDHYAKHKSLRRPCDYYLAVFSPAFIGRALDSVTYSDPEKAYRQNKGLDRNKDGAITIGEICATWHSRLAQGQSRPPILVETDLPVTPPGPEPLRAGVDLSGGAAFVIGAVLGWFVLRRR